LVSDAPSDTEKVADEGIHDQQVGPGHECPAYSEVFILFEWTKTWIGWALLPKARLMRASGIGPG